MFMKLALCDTNLANIYFGSVTRILTAYAIFCGGIMYVFSIHTEKL